MERTQVTLRREVKRARDALHTSIYGTLDASAQAEPFHEPLLNFGISGKACDTRVLNESEEAVFEPSHGRWMLRSPFPSLERDTPE